MAAPHVRARRREHQAARLLGVKRVRRPSRYVSAPDVERVTLPSGEHVSAEVKTRATLPKWLVGALEQARRYGMPGDVPVAVVSQLRGEPIALVPLADLVRLLGVETDRDEGDDGRQPWLPFAEVPGKQAR